MNIGPGALLKDAATGDLQAQRAMADYALSAFAETDSDPRTIVREGLIFARLAAAHGDRADHGRLLLMLSLAADIADTQSERDDLDAEALARLSILADGGIDSAADQLPVLGGIVSANAAVRASKFLELLADGPGARRSADYQPRPATGPTLDRTTP